MIRVCKSMFILQLVIRMSFTCQIRLVHSIVQNLYTCTNFCCLLKLLNDICQFPSIVDFLFPPPGLPVSNLHYIFYF